MNHERQARGSLWTATLWMTAISLALIWLTVIGPLVAGFVGGRKAGSLPTAIAATIVPIALNAVVLALMWDAFDLWRFGAFGRNALTFSLISYAVTLVIAAVIGAVSRRQSIG